MAKKNRGASPFNLSFLDIMACGFGAVTLLFLLLKHNTVDSPDPTLRAEVDLLNEEIRQAEENKVVVRNSLEQLDKEWVEAQGLSDRVLKQLQDARERSIQADPEEEVAKLRRQVQALEKETAELEKTANDKDLRSFAGDGDRQYLTGLKLGGKRILFLVDSSASMLAEDIVNVIRRRNMGNDIKRQSDKWVRATRTTEWLLARIPPTSQFQLVSFNTKTADLSGGNWQSASDNSAVNNAISALKKTIPEGGTSLIRAFEKLKSLSPMPDNVFLITDGLPTQGRSKVRGNTVSGKEREAFFSEAVSSLPRVPVNIILFPMEGDPAAAGLFWQLGLVSGGSFLSPSQDWP